MDINQAFRLSTNVTGWLKDDEMKCLYELARQTPSKEAIVELGAWQGKSTIMLAGGSQAGNGAPVFSVDFFSTIPKTDIAYADHLAGCNDYLEVYRQNLGRAELSTLVTPIRSNTAAAGKAWTGQPVGLLFIDADHRYAGVRDDFLGWAPHCSEGARIAFHDCGRAEYWGVQQFVDRLLAAGIIVDTEQVDSIIHGRLAVVGGNAIRRVLAKHPYWLCRLRNKLRAITPKRSGSAANVPV
jgi:MMP 1-O-methyltransferase